MQIAWTGKKTNEVKLKSGLWVKIPDTRMVPKVKCSGFNELWITAYYTLVKGKQFGHLAVRMMRETSQDSTGDFKLLVDDEGVWRFCRTWMGALKEPMYWQVKGDRGIATLSVKTRYSKIGW